MRQMMKYQYAVKKGGTFLDEIWVCADCRRVHSDLILIGKWRLVDKSIDPELTCRKGCHSGQLIRPRGFFSKRAGD